MSKLGMSLFAGAVMLGAIACDDGVADTTQNALKCQKICNAVDDCTGKDNSTSCRKECTDKSENDDFETKAAECSSCVDRDDSCSKNVINCASECAAVVTLSST
jgi:hypothetical protein